MLFARRLLQHAKLPHLVDAQSDTWHRHMLHNYVPLPVDFSKGVGNACCKLIRCAIGNLPPPGE
jgi:hypothetical protein